MLAAAPGRRRQDSHPEILPTRRWKSCRPSGFARIRKFLLVAPSRIEHVERGKVRGAGRLLPVGDIYRKSFGELIRAHNQP